MDARYAREEPRDWDAYGEMYKATPREYWTAVADRLRADIDSIPAGPMSREAYEGECARFGVAPRPDGKYMAPDGGEFWVPEYGELEIIDVTLRGRRRAAVVAPIRAAEEARAAAWRAREDARVPDVCPRCHANQATDLGVCQACFDDDFR